MRYVYDDGGRAAAGFRGPAGDCVTRAIAIATGDDYRAVYDCLHSCIKAMAPRRAKSKGNSPRDGVPMAVIRHYMAGLGWTWTPTMFIGQGCKVHLRSEELPSGRLVVRTSRHLTAVIDGVVHDTHDPSRDGTRCVYGYWRGPS